MGPRAAEARCAPAGAPTRRSRPCRARPIPSRSSNWRARSGNDEGSGDFVTDLVGKIFGKDVLADPEPFGLKRMTKEEWPDQWPANTTDFDVEPLETDDTVELREVVRPVLKQTQMEFLELGLAYDANVHGWSASSFHTQMDGQGAGLLVGVTDSGQTFGGYNPRVSSHNNQHIHPPSVHPDVSDPLAAPSPSFCLLLSPSDQGWLGYGEWRDAISAFLFVYQGKGNPVKSAKVGGSGMAIIDESGQGPQWGPDGLKISLSSRQAKSRLGTYYERTTLGKSLFGGDPSTPVGLRELRCYVAVEETELARNYKPNAFQWQEGELEEIRKNDDGDGDSLLDKIFKNFNQ